MQTANNATQFAPLMVPQSSAFIDLDSDLTAGQCISCGEWEGVLCLYSVAQPFHFYPSTLNF